MDRTEQGEATVVAQRHQRRTAVAGATNEIGIVLYPGVQAACVHGLTDLFEMPPTLRAINSGTVDPRFALRTGGQRITAIPYFHAYMIALRARTHSRGS